MIRFPNGDFEYDFTQRAVPTIGETLRRKNMLWLVTRITRELVQVVHVERVTAMSSGARRAANFPSGPIN